MKIPVLIALALGMLLNACASVPPGEDARGAALRFSATPVLDAIARFQHDRGRPPSSMYELVPDYLKSLPPEPAVYYDSYTGVAEFSYSPDWPPNTRYRCTAKLDERDWVCKPP